MCCCDDWISGLAREHAGQLAAVARREGMTPAEALDAVQDAFHTLLVRSDLRPTARLDAECGLSAGDDRAERLLVTIVRNAARNLRKKHSRSREHVSVPEALVDATPRPDDVVAQRETVEQLATCMARLTDVHRHVVTMRVLEELSSEEAARTLGVTKDHVAVLLHRARKELALCMGDAAAATG